ncbi:hypothetical protein AAHB64_23130 [Bacillus toyonensis]
MHLNKYYFHKNELSQFLNYFAKKEITDILPIQKHGNKNQNKKKKKEKKQKQEKNKPTTNFLTVKQASEKLQAPPIWLRGLLKDYFPNSKKVPASGGYHWLVSKTDIANFQKNTTTIIKQECYI